MNEWRELKTLQEVAEAQKNGEEIESNTGLCWIKWDGFHWSHTTFFRSRPRKKTKTIVLREALVQSFSDHYWSQWATTEDIFGPCFVRWLDTPPREIEVPDAD